MPDKGRHQQRQRQAGELHALPHQHTEHRKALGEGVQCITSANQAQVYRAGCQKFRQRPHCAFHEHNRWLCFSSFRYASISSPKKRLASILLATASKLCLIRRKASLSLFALASAVNFISTKSGATAWRTERSVIPLVMLTSLQARTFSKSTRLISRLPAFIRLRLTGRLKVESLNSRLPISLSSRLKLPLHSVFIKVSVPAFPPFGSIAADIAFQAIAPL